MWRNTKKGTEKETALEGRGGRKMEKRNPRGKGQGGEKQKKRVGSAAVGGEEAGKRAQEEGKILKNGVQMPERL